MKKKSKILHMALYNIILDWLACYRQETEERANFAGRVGYYFVYELVNPLLNRFSVDR